MYPPADYMRSVDFSDQQPHHRQVVPTAAYARRYSSSQSSSECSSVRNRSVRSTSSSGRSTTSSLMGGGQFMPGDPGGFIVPHQPANCYGEMSASTDCSPYPLGFVLPGRSGNTYPNHNHYHSHPNPHRQQSKQSQQSQQNYQSYQNPPQKHVTWNLPPSNPQSPRLNPQSTVASSHSGSGLNASMPAFLSSQQQHRQQYQQMTPSLYTIQDTAILPQTDRPAMHSSYIASNPQIVPSRADSSASRYSSTSLPAVSLGPAAFSYAALQQQQQYQQQPVVDGPQPSQYMEFKRRQRYEQQ
ncbi:hypothetical protein LPJ74_006125 [Coemansia sp. RSA 1843]|nr:hypothetical protein LPJ74_006125 [Coemansia sp. RSA 1843]